MRCLKRNKKAFWYALYRDKQPVFDEYGNRTGAVKIIYSEPQRLEANISPAMGDSQVEQFGNSVQYDKVIVLDDVNCPIDENTVLFVDTAPQTDEDGNLLFDYIVKKVAKSLNSVAIAIKKVEVS